MAIDPVKLTWRRGKTVPNIMTALRGAAVVNGNTAYFSRENSVYSYTLSKDEWTKLPPCEYEHFGLAVVNDKVTTIGGWNGGRATNTLVSRNEGVLGWGAKWRKLHPSMPTARVRPGTVTTPTHLIVAGGMTGPYNRDGTGLSTVEILDTNSLQWSSASSSPQALEYPHMSLCGEHLYLSEHNKTFSCSVKQILKPRTTNNSDGGSVWTKLADTPVQKHTSLTTLRGQVLAIGGSDDGTPTGAIHRYDRSTNSWSVIGEMPTPRSHPLLAVVRNNELIVVGGVVEKEHLKYHDVTEIASCYY